MEPIGMCIQCRENHNKIFKEHQEMWQSFIDAAQGKKDKRYYQNCKQIDIDMCGPDGTCKYWRK